MSVMMLSLLVFGSPLMAVILRTAIEVSNRILGDRESRLETVEVHSHATPQPDEGEYNPFASPSVQTMVVEIPGVIPMPSFSRACWLALLNLAVTMIATIFAIVGLTDGPVGMLAVLAGQAAFTLILKYALPTTLGRSALVVFLCWVIALLVWFLVIVAVRLLMN
ncbi:MAG: hypothetical protein R3C49_14620 [Planctomycetaceae bacterium]